MTRNITTRKYASLHAVSEICMILCMLTCYRLRNISLIIAGASTRSFGTTVQQCQSWAERGQAGQAMAWALPDHREGSVSIV